MIGRLWQSNIGKAWQIIRSDGILRGCRRILEGIYRLIPRKLEGDILIVTSGVGDTARYRGEHVAEELRWHGFRVAVTTQYHPLLSRYADAFSVYVFHRTLYAGEVKKLFDKAKSLSKTLVFETDDLVYDPMFVRQMDFYRSMNPLEKKLYEHGIGGEILSDGSVEAATTTTGYIAEKLREKGKRVFVVKNKLSQEDIGWAEEAVASRQSESSGMIRVGYASGTATHNKDFLAITEALLYLLLTHKNMILVIAGPLVLDDRFAPYHDRIERLPFADRRTHFKNLASFDINLAPLEIGQPFCEGKSELKFFEAGIVAVPTVAAATQTFREAIRDDIDGYVAGGTDEWIEKLETLILQSDVRKQMGAAARATALGSYTTHLADNQEYYGYLREKIPKT